MAAGTIGTCRPSAVEMANQLGSLAGAVTRRTLGKQTLASGIFRRAGETTCGHRPWPAVRDSRRCRQSRSLPPPTAMPRPAAPTSIVFLTTATSSRHSTSRGHARHTDTSASSSSRVFTASAMATTCAGVSATAVRDVAGSPGQPTPGGTGESNKAPVRGWASFTRPLCLRGKIACRATQAAVRFGRDTS